MEVKPISHIKPSQLSKFNCGVEELNTYLKRFAKKNDKLGIGRTYVLIENSQAIGYYTVSMAQIEVKSLPKDTQNRLPKYPLPAVRIGRLAIATNAQGKGFGEHLLMDALTRSVRASLDIAVYAIIVDAKDRKARNFYLRYGFIPFEDQELSLFLPIDTIIGEGSDGTFGHS